MNQNYLCIVPLFILILFGTLTASASSNYEQFKVFQNVQIPGSNDTFNIKYDVQRKLVEVTTETLRKSITFTFAGKITNDVFTVILPKNLVQGPFTIWLDKTQITNFGVDNLNEESVLRIPLFDRTEQTIIVGSKIAGTYVPKESPIINKLHAEIEDKIYVKGDKIVVVGNVENRLGLDHITLSIIGSKENIIIVDTLQINDDSTFSTAISTATALWDAGTYTIKITGIDANPYSNTIEVTEFLLPKWLKANAGWWAQDKIDDSTFASGIQYMIEEQIIRIPNAKSHPNSAVTEIPSWIKTNAAWWHEGRITDSDFVVGIQFLIENGVISII